MSILSKIGSLLKKLWDGLVKLIKKFWPIILLIIIIVISIYFPAFWTVAWQYISTFFATVGGWIGSAASAVGSWASGALDWAGAKFSSMGIADALKLAAGVAIVADPEAVLDGVGDVLSSIASSIPGWVWLVGGGVLLFWLLPSRDKSDTVVIRAPTASEGDTYA